jgi:hypothetical protein
MADYVTCCLTLGEQRLSRRNLHATVLLLKTRISARLFSCKVRIRRPTTREARARRASQSSAGLINYTGDQRKNVHEFLTDKQEGLEMDAKVFICLFWHPRVSSTVRRLQLFSTDTCYSSLKSTVSEATSSMVAFNPSPPWPR